MVLWLMVYKIFMVFPLIAVLFRAILMNCVSNKSVLNDKFGTLQISNRKCAIFCVPCRIFIGWLIRKHLNKGFVHELRNGLEFFWV